MKRVAFFLFLLLTVGEEAAAYGTAHGYTVENVRVDRSGKGYVKFTTALGGEPAACVSGHTSHFAFDTNTAGGRAILSLVLSAQASKKKIHAKGAGECDIYGVVESWLEGWIVGP